MGDCGRAGRWRLRQSLQGEGLVDCACRALRAPDPRAAASEHFLCAPHWTQRDVCRTSASQGGYPRRPREHGDGDTSFKAGLHRCYGNVKAQDCTWEGWELGTLLKMSLRQTLRWTEGPWSERGQAAAGGLNGRRGEGPVTAAAGHRFGFWTPESPEAPCLQLPLPWRKTGQSLCEEWVGQG